MENNRQDNNETERLEKNEFHRLGLNYLSKEDEDKQMPEILTQFGVVSKAVQSVPKEEEMENPYWASSHEYDSSVEMWGKHKIQVTEFEQSGLTHHFGVISLGMADAICKVPALPAATDSLEICKRTLNDDVTDQYQRPLEFERIENIERFLTTSPTIVNPVIIEISKSAISDGSAKIVGDDIFKTLEIDMQKIRYIRDNLKDVDISKGIDYRPIDLVDGQHRIRSSRLSADAMNLLIPFVIVDPKYEGGGGRIFAEINVQSNDLPKLHKLHLRYVLKLASHKEKDDFGHVPESYTDQTEDFSDELVTLYERRFANRMAYRVGARLCLNKESPLHDMILFYGKGRSEVMKPIDAYDWIEHCNPWVLQFSELANSEDDFVRTIQNYFQAWKVTANIDPKTGISYHDSDVNNRWGKGVGNTETSTLWSKLFNKIMFKSIMALFPLTYKMSGMNLQSTDEEMIQAFLEILKPCRPIDGLDLEAWKTIMEAGSNSKEKENHIYQWMSWAIYAYNKTGKLIDPELAWNVIDGEPTDVLSAPGQGFFSPVNPDYFSGTLKIEGISDDYWEGLNQATITFTVNEMPNESIPKTISMTYFDRNGNERPERRTKHTKGPRNSIGFNYLSQLFQSSTKTHGVTAVEITVTSGNLFSAGAVPVFRQKYDIDELRALNNSGLFLGSSMYLGESSVDDVVIQPFNVKQDSSVNQYVVIPGENFIEKEIEEPPVDEIDSFFDAPPPRNMCYQTWKEFNYRRAFRPTATPCMGCLSGSHNQENCGYRRYY